MDGGGAVVMFVKAIEVLSKPSNGYVLVKKIIGGYKNAVMSNGCTKFHVCGRTRGFCRERRFQSMTPFRDTDYLFKIPMPNRLMVRRKPMYVTPPTRRSWGLIPI